MPGFLNEKDTVLLFFLCFSSPLFTGKGPEFHFKDKDGTYNFGTEPEGTRAHDFVFENSGDEPLLIPSVVSGCGCMVATWPEKPVLPGKTAVIKVGLDTRTRIGQVHKTVAVYASTGNNSRYHQLTLKSRVIP